MAKKNQCKGKASSTGERCKNPCIAGYKHCYAHLDARELARYSKVNGNEDKGLTGLAGSRKGRRSVSW